MTDSPKDTVQERCRECGHSKEAHFDATAIGSFCKECPIERNVWEHFYVANAQPAPPTGEEMRRQVEHFYWDWARLPENTFPYWGNQAMFERALKLAMDYRAYQAGAEGQGGKK